MRRKARNSVQLGRGGFAAAAVFVWLIGYATYSAAAPVQIDFWWGEGSGIASEAIDTVVAEFNQSDPSVHVNLTKLGYLGSGAGLDKLKAAVAAGNPPDVAYVDASYLLSQAVAGGLYRPLDQVIAHDALDAIDYLPAPSRYVTFEGHTYGMQFRTDSRGIYFNQDLFEAAGLDPTTGPKDTAQLDAFAEKLTQRDASGKVAQLGFAPRGNNFGAGLGWLRMFGGRVYDYDRSGMAAVIPNGARHPEAAAKFILYLSKPETQVEWYRLTRQVPARADALQTLLRSGAIKDPRERNLLTPLPVGEAYPPLLSNVFLQTLGSNLDKMRQKQITPQQALEDTQRMTASLFQVP